VAMLSGAQTAKPASSPKRVITTSAALIAVILPLVSAFALPAVHSGLNGLLATIVASGQQKIQLEAALGKAGPHGRRGRQADVEG
jgi:hypothetical protein